MLLLSEEYQRKQCGTKIIEEYTPHSQYICLSVCLSSTLETLTFVHLRFIGYFITGYFLKFSQQPRDTIKESGDNASLVCTAVSPTGHVNYTWLFNDSQITDTGGNLTLTNLSKADEGEYRCIASNYYGSLLSLKAVLRIACKCVV